MAAQTSTHADDYLRIETPENVAFGYEIAGLGSRFLAALVDTILITLLQALVIVTLVLIAGNLLNLRLEASDTFIWIAAVLGLIAFGFFWGYYIFWEMLWAGQSPGKRWIGLRVIRRDGTPVTLSESIIRNLIRLVDFLPAYYGVGVVAMFIDEQTRRLGDLAAGTLVVRDKAAITLESLAARQPPALEAASPMEAAANGWPVERLTSRELDLAEDFLRRRDQLPNRAALAEQILLALCACMSLPVAQIDLARADERLAAIVQASKERV